jgi:hypothetical protein
MGSNGVASIYSIFSVSFSKQTGGARDPWPGLRQIFSPSFASHCHVRGRDRGAARRLETLYFPGSGDRSKLSEENGSDRQLSFVARPGWHCSGAVLGGCFFSSGYA